MRNLRGADVVTTGTCSVVYMLIIGDSGGGDGKRKREEVVHVPKGRRTVVKIREAAERSSE